MILNCTTEVLIRKSNIDYYIEKGYKCVKNEYANVHNKDLPEGSYYKIKVKCDKCGKASETSCRYYYKNLKNNGVYTCKSCNYKDRGKKTNKTKSKVDLKTGKTIREISEQKRAATINKKGGYKYITNKSVEARLKKDSDGLNSYEKMFRSQEFKNKRRKSCESKKLWIPKKDIKDFKLYKREVVKITESQNLELLNNIELRSRKYHLDHMFSIFEGYKRNICPYIIGNICNLQILSNSDNTVKGYNCSITETELYELFVQQENSLLSTHIKE